MLDNIITSYHNFQGHKGPITAVSFNPVIETTLASGSMDSNILTWQFGNKIRGYRLFGHSEPVFDLSYSPDGKLIASASQDKTIRLWKPDVHAEIESKEFKAHSSLIRSVKFSHDGHKLVTCGDDKVIKVWTVTKQKFLFSLTEHTNWVRCAEFSPDDKIIVSCSDDKSVKLFSVDDCSTIGVFCDSKVPISDVKFHHQGNLLAAGTIDGQVKLYDIRMRKLIHLYRFHTDKINKLAFYKEILASCSDDGSVEFVNIEYAARIGGLGLNKEQTSINCIAFSKNGEYLATGGGDNLLRIYKVSPEIDNASAKLSEIPQETEVNNHRISGGKTLSPGPDKNTKSAFLPVSPNKCMNIGKKNIIPDMNGFSELSALLNNVISQVDTLTQTMMVLERRVSLVEEKLKDSFEVKNVVTKLSDIMTKDN